MKQSRYGRLVLQVNEDELTVLLREIFRKKLKIKVKRVNEYHISGGPHGDKSYKGNIHVSLLLDGELICEGTESP